jgi:ATP-dependent Lon protease
MPLRKKNDDAKKPVKKEKELQKRKGRPDHHDDDSSVDSKGNIRDLIDDDSEEEDSSYHDSEEKGKGKGFKILNSGKLKMEKIKHVIDTDEEEEEKPKPKRKAAVAAEKKIKQKLDEEVGKIRRITKEDEERIGHLRLSKEEETEEETDEDTDEETDEEESPRNRNPPVEFIISEFGEPQYLPPKPKKYKLSKEPENVRRFVKLVQTEVDPDEEDIDRNIGYFKGLTPGAQDRLLTKLQTKIEPLEPTIPLRFQILNKEVAPEVERVALAKYSALMNIDPSSTEYYKASQWLNGYTQLPLAVFKDLPVKIEDGTDKCQAFMGEVAKCMETAIYGHDEAKLQIMQFVSSWIANPQAAGNVLSIYGPPGVGKTTLIKDGVAKALGRPFHFITLGGATDASFLDGHSYTYEGSTWGRIVDVLIKSKCMNPVIYFDELDKVSETPKGEEINNLLIHLTDGAQNDRFQDKYFTGIDLDLSRCLFIFSHNNHERVNPILRDRMYNIQVEGFGTKEKLIIAEQYLVSQTLREVNLFEKISIGKDILTYMIENHTGEEKGVRELKRCIQTMISKINLLRFYNDPAKVPFAIKGFALPFTVKKEHVDIFMKKKTVMDSSISHLYT